MTAILNKKVLLSLGVIAFVAALAAGATWAAWNATAEITGNTVGAAQLSIIATAEGKSSPIAAPLPFDVSDMLPGMTTDPELRAVITNKSDVPLDLYMYVQGAGGAACQATKIAWQSSHPGNGVINGYPADPFPPVLEVGNINGTDASEYFRNVYSSGNTYPNLWGIDNKVLIAPAAEFGPDDEIALRQIVGFAEDAPNGLQGTTCQWTLHFVAETETI